MRQVTMNQINAYLDGGLAEPERREFEATVAYDPEAQAILAFHQQHVLELHRLYDPILSEPVPERMLDLLRRHNL